MAVGQMQALDSVKQLVKLLVQSANVWRSLEHLIAVNNQQTGSDLPADICEERSKVFAPYGSLMHAAKYVKYCPTLEK